MRNGKNLMTFNCEVDSDNVVIYTAVKKNEAVKFRGR